MNCRSDIAYTRKANQKNHFRESEFQTINFARATERIIIHSDSLLAYDDRRHFANPRNGTASQKQLVGAAFVVRWSGQARVCLVL